MRLQMIGACTDVIVGWREANLQHRGGRHGECLGGHICGQKSRKIVSGLCNQMDALVYLYSRNIGRSWWVPFRMCRNWDSYRTSKSGAQWRDLNWRYGFVNHQLRDDFWSWENGCKYQGVCIKRRVVGESEVQLWRAPDFILFRGKEPTEETWKTKQNVPKKEENLISGLANCM